MVEATRAGQDNPKTPDWKLWVNGSSAKASGGAGAILEDPNSIQVEYAARFKFPVSNNVSKYEALIARLRFAAKREAKYIDVFSYSKLVASQVSGRFEVKTPTLIKYQDMVLMRPIPMIYHNSHSTGRKHESLCLVELWPSRLKEPFM